MNEHFKRAGPAVEAHYQFLLWLVPTVDRFPKSQKFVFGDRVLNLALDVLEGANEVVESRHFCCAAYVRYWQCASKARIISGGRFHPESCRLIRKLTSSLAG